MIAGVDRVRAFQCPQIGDIGDNNAVRENGLLVHRVLEPQPTDQAEVTTEPPTSFRLRYPDGPGDAETLLVHPRTGRLYVVTKPLADRVSYALIDRFARKGKLPSDHAPLLVDVEAS